MGFFQSQRNTFIMSFDATHKVVRPLSKEAITKWVHTISKCEGVGPDNKKYTIRNFRMVDGDFTQWLRNNQDPLWDQLEHDRKFKQNGERQDFPIRPIHFLPVWSYADNDIRLVKQGNQFFEEFGKFYDSGGDVTNCDWVCWTEGKGRTTKYLVARQDPTPFNIPLTQDVITAKIQTMMEEALKELLPFNTEDELIQFCHGMQTNGSQSLPPTQQQPQMTGGFTGGYTPGGQPNTALGNATAALPATTQAPQTPAYNPAAQVQQTMQTTPVVAQTPQTPAYNPAAQAAPQVTQTPAYNPAMQTQPSTQVTQTPAYAVSNAPQQVTPTEDEVPNAPVQGQPVFAPPVQAQPQQTVQVSNTTGQDPASIVLDFGKHSGKTLGQIFNEDRSYLTFLKGNKKELAPAVEALLSGQTSIPATNTTSPSNGASGTNGSSGNEELRQALVKECSDKLMQIPEFQGPGIAANMMPFLTNTIQTTAFSDAPIDKLQMLKQAIDQKIQAGA